jgi:hypothetical protein
MKKKLLLPALCSLAIVGCKHDMNTGRQERMDYNQHNGGSYGYQPDYNNPNNSNFNPNSPNYASGWNGNRNWQTNSSGRSNTNRVNGPLDNPANPLNK